MVAQKEWQEPKSADMIELFGFVPGPNRSARGFTQESKSWVPHTSRQWLPGNWKKQISGDFATLWAKNPTPDEEHGP
jgi:hypothetical protein